MYIAANDVGFHDRADEPPVYDPPYDAPCPFCGAPITETDVRTISLMLIGGSRSYFYRTHRTCHEAVSDAERETLDGLAFEAVEAVV